MRRTGWKLSGYGKQRGRWNNRGLVRRDVPSTAVAGSAGSAGAGGNGRSVIGTYRSDGGAGYRQGGNSGNNGGSFTRGGPGGGGGYGGGGGGSATQDPINSATSIGGAGAGGGYANPRTRQAPRSKPTTSGTYGVGGDDRNGGNGALIVNGVGPVVQTEVSAPTSVTGTGATVHSMVNGPAFRRMRRFNTRRRRRSRRSPGASPRHPRR